MAGYGLFPAYNNEDASAALSSQGSGRFQVGQQAGGESAWSAHSQYMGQVPAGAPPVAFRGEPAEMMFRGSWGGSAKFPPPQVVGGGLEQGQAMNVSMADRMQMLPSASPRPQPVQVVPSLGLQGSGGYPVGSQPDPAAGILETIQRIEGLSSNMNLRGVNIGVRSAAPATEPDLRTASPMRAAAVVPQAQLRAVSPVPLVRHGSPAPQRSTQQLRAASPMPPMQPPSPMMQQRSASPGRSAMVVVRSASPGRSSMLMTEQQLRSASPFRGTSPVGDAMLQSAVLSGSMRAGSESRRRAASPVHRLMVARDLDSTSNGLVQSARAAPGSRPRSASPGQRLIVAGEPQLQPVRMARPVAEPQLRAASPFQSVGTAGDSQPQVGSHVFRNAVTMRSASPVPSVSATAPLQSAIRMQSAGAVVEPQLQPGGFVQSMPAAGEPQLRGRSDMAAADMQYRSASPMPSFPLLGAGGATAPATGAVAAMLPPTAVPASVLPATVVPTSTVGVSDALMHTFGSQGAGASVTSTASVATAGWSNASLAPQTDNAQPISRPSSGNALSVPSAIVTGQANGAAAPPRIDDSPAPVKWSFGVKPNPVGAARPESSGAGRDPVVSTLAVGEASARSAALPVPVQTLRSPAAERLAGKDDVIAPRVLGTAPIETRSAQASASPSPVDAQNVQPPVAPASMPISSARNFAVEGQTDVVDVPMQRHVCSVVTLPEEHGKQFTDQDFKDLQETSGCSSLHLSQRNGELEIKLYGTADARTAACQEIQRVLNERVASQSDTQHGSPDAVASEPEHADTQEHLLDDSMESPWPILPQLARALERIPPNEDAPTDTGPHPEEQGIPVSAPAGSTAGTAEEEADEATTTVAVTCAELPIPAQYISLLYEEDLQEIERLTGVEITVDQPDAESSDTDWKLVVFGSAEARTEVHKIVESTLNRRLASPETDSSAAEVSDMPINSDKVSDAVDSKRAQTSETRIDQGTKTTTAEASYAQAMGVPANDSRAAATLDAPHAQLLDVTLNAGRGQPMNNGHVAGTVDVPHAYASGKVEGDDNAAREAEAARAADAARAVDGVNISKDRNAVPCTVLPLAASQMNLLFNEDLWQIRKITGCQAYVSEPGQQGAAGAWEIRLYGDPESRDHARVIVEDTLKDRLAASGGVTPEGYAFEPPSKDVAISKPEPAPSSETEPEALIDVGVSYPLDSIPETPVAQEQGAPAAVGVEDEAAQKKLVPCTVLPITREYVQMLKDLDKIQEETGCHIQVSEPDAEAKTGWQLGLFGTAEARQQAHREIEDALTAAVAESANSE